VWFRKFKNCFIYEGKKQKVENIFKYFILQIKLQYSINPIIFFYNSLIINRMPFNVNPIRQGKKILILPNYLLPIEQYRFSFLLLVKMVKQRPEENIIEKLFFEFSALVLERQNVLIDHPLKIELFIIGVNNRTKLHYR
jgi:ribosomal protein S7